jgi:hypothetical protein
LQRADAVLDEQGEAFLVRVGSDPSGLRILEILLERVVHQAKAGRRLGDLVLKIIFRQVERDGEARKQGPSKPV